MSGRAGGLQQNLNAAKRAKNDEFYTRLEDIEREIYHYKDHFRGKVVYCNCDDPRVSGFFHYFSQGFERLGLKRLITTCYKNQEPTLFSRHDQESAISLTYDGDRNGNRVPDPEEIGIHQLKGDGDFRSQEAVEMLHEADIVVTNPPFSLFREFVAQLVEHDKKFLIVGNQNAITYKEIFPLIRDEKVWLGINPEGRDMLFDIPDDCVANLLATRKEGSAYRIVNGSVKRRLGNAAWFTNMEHKRRREPLPIFRMFKPDDYPRYDNYDAINVDKVMDIPVDYGGAMGVPITYLGKHNPDQFEILGSNRGRDQDPEGVYGRGSFLNGKETFKRIFIRRRSASGAEAVT